MSTFIRGVNLSKKWLKTVLITVLALVCATAITLGILFSERKDYSVTPEPGNNVENLDSEALLTSAGWSDLAYTLVNSVNSHGDNIALGNSGGVVSSPVVKLGGISWTVVYSQNGIVTLLANESVAELAFGGENYKESDVRDYLLNEFYPELLSAIGEQNASLIVPYGDKSIYYQADGAQAVQISTLNNDDIVDNDGVVGDKVWLPSAYEVGGFANTDTSPKARVNSFKTIDQDGFEVNSGLWNTSNEMRLAVNNAWLRSNINNDQAIIQNGVIKSADEGQILSVRPCINLALPQYSSNEVVSVSAGEAVSSSSTLLVAPDYKGMFTDSLENGGGAAAGDGSSKSPFTVSNSRMLVLISDAVMAGQDLSGVYFRMTNDIDMSDVTVWDPIGRANFPFRGNFDGDGYVISNLATAGSGLVGLFGNIENAVVQRVGVIDSSWYTSNSNVGAIAGTAIKSLISQCFSNSGVSGYNNVGGLVGSLVSSTSTFSVSADNATAGLVNSYNLSGVSGYGNVGGLVGSVSSSTIANCYNIGIAQAVSGATGGVAGAFSGTAQNVVFYNNADDSVNGTTLVTSYDSLRSKSTYSGWTFSKDVWFISNVANDRLPMLYIFLKNVDVNLLSSNSACSVSGGGTNLAINSSVTITATAAFSDSTGHYVFDGWYKYDIDSAGNKIENLDQNGNVIYDESDRVISASSTTKSATTGGFNYTYTFNNIDDYYNLEARFIRLYNFDALYNGFSEQYEASDFTMTYEVGSEPLNSNLDAWSTGNGDKWFREDSVVHVDLGSATNRIFTSLYYGTNKATPTTVVPEGDQFIGTASGGVYTITINNDYNTYASSDYYTLQPRFDRLYQITTSIDPSTDTTTAGVTPETSVTFTNASGSSATVTSTATSTEYSRYNNTVLNASVKNTSALNGRLTFSQWSLRNGATVLAAQSNQTASPTFNLSSVLTSNQPADDVVVLSVVASFDRASKTVIINEYLDSALNDAPGKVVLSNSRITDTSTIAGMAQNLQVNAQYGSTVYVYVLPDYTAGYGFSSTKIPGGLTADGNGVYCGSFAVTDTTASPTYKVVYETRDDYSLSFNVLLDGSAPTAGLITLTASPTSGLGINASLTGYTTQVTGANYQAYYMDNVVISVGGQPITLNYAPNNGAYVGTNQAQQIFRGLTTQTIAGIYTQMGVAAGLNNTAISVTVNYISVTQSVTIVQYLDKVQQSLDTSLYSITSGVLGGGSINGKYLRNDTITISINQRGFGYRVDNITISGVTGFSDGPTYTPNNTTYNNSATASFVLSTDATVNVYYTSHPYTMTIYDNLNSDITVSGVSIDSIDATGVANSYSASVNSSSVSPATPLNVKFNDTVVISGYNVSANTSVSNQRVLLDEIYIVDQAGNVIIRYGVENSINFSLNNTYLNESITGLNVIFKYIKLQALNIQFTNDSGTQVGGESAVLVVLQNDEDPSDRIVLILGEGDSATPEVQVGTYTMTMSVSIFIRTTVSGDASDGSDNTYTVSIANGQSADVSIAISEIINGNGSVFGSGTI